MSFETFISWRYLRCVQRSRLIAFGAFFFVLVTCVSSYILFIQESFRTSVILVLVASMLVSVLFICLYWFSTITAMSILGVSLGVAALTIVLGVTTGFQEQFRNKILGVNAHALLMKRSFNFSEYRDVQKKVMENSDEVVAMQPFVFAEMLVTRGSGEIAGVALKGIDPEKSHQVLNLEKHMIEGSLDALNSSNEKYPSVLIGKDLAEKLDVQMGELVTLVSPLSYMNLERWFSVDKDKPAAAKFRIEGIFYAGFAEYDRRLVYVNYRDAQQLLRRGDVVMGLEMRLQSPDNAADTVEKLTAILDDPQYIIQDWRELNANLFRALMLQKAGLLVVLTLIVGVAVFNLLSVLTMMIINKTQEIAILRSMGATSRHIIRIFCQAGFFIGFIGTAIGSCMGFVLCGIVSGYGYSLDPSIYLIDKLPVSIRGIEFLTIIVVTLLISTLTTLFPAIRASRLLPVSGLRYDYEDNS